MANRNDVSVALSGLGFEAAGNFRFGTWNNYAMLLQTMGNSIYAIVSVEIPSAWGSVRKSLNRTLKEKGLKGVKLGGLTKTAATFVLAFGKTDRPSGFFTDAMNALTMSLRENGIAPADHCALTGAGNPDSLCMVSKNGALGYRPVCAAAVRDRESQTREKIEENQANGSYVLGFVGALLGMLVGLIPNVLGIIFADTIWSLLFALVPLAAMFGYKLFQGKMSRGSIVIVIACSLLGVLLIPFFEIIVYLVKDYSVPLGNALGYAMQIFREPGFFAEAATEYLQLLLFMALGIWIAWKTMSSQTNNSQALSTETQLATLRPNPACAPTEEVGY